tara:strand:+ start:1065 stop:2339 length:1275 start_codon:yes stop_codon:yes gene_type:complete
MDKNKRGLKIAVIGAGAAGLTAAYLLNKENDVYLFEKNSYFGGHANTITTDENNGQTFDIDTGFIVFNDKNYPNFSKLINELEIPFKKSDMSFTYYSVNPLRLYSSDIPFGMFGLKRNIFNYKFYSFLYSILEFNKIAINDVSNGIDDNQTLQDYLNQYNFSKQLIEDYIVPMGAAIWSASFNDILDFPAKTFLNFWNNHGLLQLQGRPQWYTVEGGSRMYVKKIIASLKNKPQFNSAISVVRRTKSYVMIKMKDGIEHMFDKVVIGTHADEALKLLEDPTPSERELLGQWSYSNNKTYFHTDERVMPPRKQCWTSWNYVKESNDTQDPVSLTYWMNRLQSIPSKTPYLVTLNTKVDIKEEHIIRELNYTHPIFSNKALKTQPKLPSLNGINQTYFCGSYFKNGFHEDAVSSAINAVKSLGVEW